MLSRSLFPWIHNKNNLKIFTSQHITVDEVKSLVKEKSVMLLFILQPIIL